MEKVLFLKSMMRYGIYLKNKNIESNPRFQALVGVLRGAGCELYRLNDRTSLRPDTDAVLSVGGDGTFLSAAGVVADSGVPVLGVNLGRLGFLSENQPEDVAEALTCGGFEVEERTMLRARLSGDAGEDIGFWPYALNEVTVHRSGMSMLGINVTVNGYRLPTYWADGLLVATSSGSTAYSLSVGGPICAPDAKVLIISPIAPHNLNVRPFIVPESTEIGISLCSRDGKVNLTIDNRMRAIAPSAAISISMAQFSLKRLKLPKSNFVNALVDKLFWGEDIRNNGD